PSTITAATDSSGGQSCSAGCRASTGPSKRSATGAQLSNTSSNTAITTTLPPALRQRNRSRNPKNNNPVQNGSGIRSCAAMTLIRVQKLTSVKHRSLSCSYWQVRLSSPKPGKNGLDGLHYDQNIQPKRE